MHDASASTQPVPARSALRWILHGLAACVWLVLVLMAAGQWFLVRPYEQAVQGILAKMDPQERHPPAMVGRALHAEYPARDTLVDVVTTLVWFKLVGPTWHSASRFGWQEEAIHLACRRLSDDQLVALYAATTHQLGLGREARETFARPLDSLSDDQVLALMAMGKFPYPPRSAGEIEERRRFLRDRIASQESHDLQARAQ